MNRRDFVVGSAATAAALTLPHLLQAERAELAPIWAEIEKRHDESVKRLQTWIRQPSIAAENREVNEGCELTMQMLRDAGFQSVSKVPTDGHPGIFATLDAGAPKTLGVYFMYDVKQVTPSEWSSPPWDAALLDKPGVGKVVVGRGAVNQKGPEATFLAALHAIRGAGRKLPVNLVLVVLHPVVVGVRFDETDGVVQLVHLRLQCGDVVFLRQNLALPLLGRLAAGRTCRRGCGLQFSYRLLLAGRQVRAFGKVFVGDDFLFRSTFRPFLLASLAGNIPERLPITGHRGQQHEQKNFVDSAHERLPALRANAGAALTMVAWVGFGP